jgi:uncharacterized protein (DUF983 family)
LNQGLDTLCPRCGKNTLIRKELENGRYVIVCTSCGLMRGELPPDEKKGVV